MAGGGTPEKTGINWAPVGLAFNILVVIVAGLMGYAYINGGTGSRLDRLEADLRDRATKQDIAAIQATMTDRGHARDRQLEDIERRMDRWERRR